jgi:hypothetical protein
LCTLWQFAAAESIVERMSEEMADAIARRLRVVAGWLERVLLLGLVDGGPVVARELESVFTGRPLAASVGRAGQQWPARCAGGMRATSCGVRRSVRASRHGRQPSGRSPPADA